MKFLLILPALILCGCASAKPKYCAQVYTDHHELHQAFRAQSQRLVDLEMENAGLRAANEWILGRSKPEQPRDQQGRFIKGVDTVK